jgi:hypothetical protein
MCHCVAQCMHSTCKNCLTFQHATAYCGTHCTPPARSCYSSRFDCALYSDCICCGAVLHLQCNSSGAIAHVCIHKPATRMTVLVAIFRMWTCCLRLCKSLLRPGHDYTSVHVL